jgi:hypothetical protein
MVRLKNVTPSSTYYDLTLNENSKTNSIIAPHLSKLVSATKNLSKL